MDTLKINSYHKYVAVYVFFLLSIVFIVWNPLYAKSMQYEIKKNFSTQLKVSTKNDDIIGGYAKYKVTLYVSTQGDIDFLSNKQDEVVKVIEKSVSNCNAQQLQSHADRRILESQITKRLNEVFGKSLVKATFFANMTIIPDMSYRP